MWSAGSKSSETLFAEPDLKFNKAFEIAQAMEAADKDAEELSGGTYKFPRHRSGL